MLLEEHKMDCPTCGVRMPRRWAKIGFYHGNPAPLYYPDGSYEEK